MVMGDGLGEHLKHLKQIHSVHLVPRKPSSSQLCCCAVFVGAIKRCANVVALRIKRTAKRGALFPDRKQW